MSSAGSKRAHEPRHVPATVPSSRMIGFKQRPHVPDRLLPSPHDSRSQHRSPQRASGRQRIGVPLTRFIFRDKRRRSSAAKKPARPLRVKPNLSNYSNLICPVQSRFEKFFVSFQGQIISSRSCAIPSRTGAFAIVTNVGCGMRWTRGVVAQGRVQGGFLRAREHGAGAWTSGAGADGKAVWSWRPLLVSSRRRCCEPNRAYKIFNPPATVTRRIRRRGERVISR